MSNKGELRRQFRAQRGSLDAAEASAFVRRVLHEWLLEHIPSGSGRIWGGYQALPDEPNLAPLYQDFQARGVSWAYPLVEGERLRFFHVDGEIANERGTWVQGAWGLREPDPTRCREVSLASLSGLLVPGVAFDRRGVRLGRGKGFYDRALQTFTGIKIGVAFRDRLVSEELPLDAHDIRMDWIATEDGVQRARANADLDNDEAHASKRKGRKDD